MVELDEVVEGDVSAAVLEVEPLGPGLDLLGDGAIDGVDTARVDLSQEVLKSKALSVQTSADQTCNL